VRDLATGRCYITAQNHGYAVDAEGLRGGAEVSHVNLNDGTVEGLRHRNLPVLTIQYHSEASPGPLDNTYLFERFLAMVKETVRPGGLGARGKDTGMPSDEATFARPPSMTPRHRRGHQPHRAGA
jgi:hypothetical protein